MLRMGGRRATRREPESGLWVIHTIWCKRRQQHERLVLKSGAPWMASGREALRGPAGAESDPCARRSTAWWSTPAANAPDPKLHARACRSPQGKGTQWLGQDPKLESHSQGQIWGGSIGWRELFWEAPPVRVVSQPRMAAPLLISPIPTA